MCYVDNDEPIVGPAIPTAVMTPEEEAEYERLSIIKRAEAMKKKLEQGDEKPLERETWMTELPDFRTVRILMNSSFHQTQG